MNRADFTDLCELARLHGLQVAYVDAGGAGQRAAPEVLTAVLKALGVPAGNTREIRHSLRETRFRRHSRLVEPVAVAWEKRPAKVELHLPAREAATPLRLRLRLENGGVRNLRPRTTARRPAEIEGERFVTQQLALPALPSGYHELEIAAGNLVGRTRLISAPERSCGARMKKSWGAFLPLYAAHSEQSWGAGNFSDWQQLSARVASLGGTVAATLPVLAAFLDFPGCEPSPYSPASRLFWNEFYLDLIRVPEFPRCEAAQRLVRSTGFQNQLRAFRASDAIDYAAQWAARRKVLERLAEYFFSRTSSRRAAFDRYVRQRPEVEDYAAFRAVCDRRKTSWRQWPERLRDGRLAPGDYDEAVKRFHLYAQWLAQEQIDRLAAAGRRRGVKLYLDLPLGVNPDGYDVWRERDSFVLGANAGAPPDLFFTKGQDWGFAPLHPQRIRESGYRHVLAYLRFQMRHAGILRIDHVMGLHRLYWIPQGFPAARGVYVSYPAEELHAIFNLESHRHRTRLVGENLGTVPPEVNESMRRHRLREMFVVQYESRPDAKAALRKPPALSVASLNTHDMPPFAAFLKGLDLDDRRQLGLIPKNRMPQEQKERRWLKEALVKFLVQHAGLKNSQRVADWAVLEACLRWLAKSPCELVLVSLEDLWLETLPQNVPGTSIERANWRRKARLTLEEMFRKPELRRIFSQLRR